MLFTVSSVLTSMTLLACWGHHRWHILLLSFGSGYDNPGVPIYCHWFVGDALSHLFWLTICHHPQTVSFSEPSHNHFLNCLWLGMAWTVSLPSPPMINCGDYADGYFIKHFAPMLLSTFIQYSFRKLNSWCYAWLKILAIMNIITLCKGTIHSFITFLHIVLF